MVCALYVVITNWSELPGVVTLVLDSVFPGHAAVGGFAGAAVTNAIRSGIAKGFSPMKPASEARPSCMLRR